VEGVENIPGEGPAILASNHLSFIDSLFLPLVVPRRVTFLAKMDYFTQRGVKGRLKKMFFSGVGQLPIDRSGGRASMAAISTGKSVLAEGNLLGIYPEGTRSPDGRLYRGKTGVARMALEAGVPVIPCAMIGTYEIQPSGRTFPKIRRVGIRVGRPLDFSRYAGLEGDTYVLRSVTDEIMYELMTLSGQEYVDTYALAAKKRLHAARAAAASATPAPPAVTAAPAPTAAAAPAAPPAPPVASVPPAQPAVPAVPVDGGNAGGRNGAGIEVAADGVQRRVS
jgi:1-acyl-sn-glycerol-3-phosphate acyltransferase